MADDSLLLNYGAVMMYLIYSTWHTRRLATALSVSDAKDKA